MILGEATMAATLTESDIYVVIGETSIKFANLEYAISAILEVLIDSRTPAIGAVLTT